MKNVKVFVKAMVLLTLTDSMFPLNYTDRKVKCKMVAKVFLVALNGYIALILPCCLCLGILLRNSPKLNSS